MKIAIIGTGKMARGFAKALAQLHEVTLGSRDAGRADEAAAATRATRGATYADAAADAEVVILAVPRDAMEVTLPYARVFKGWNHVHARDLTSPEVDGIAASVLIAGDDPKAKQIV